MTDAKANYPKINQVSLITLDTEDLTPRWLITNWLEETDIAIVIGDPYVGKSWLALHVALSISRGKAWYPQFTIPAAHRVLFIDEDNPDNTAKRRIQNYARKHRGKPSDWSGCFNYWVSNFITLQSLLDFEERGYFALITKLKPRLIIIDTLYSFGNADISNQKEVANLKTGLRKFQAHFKEIVGHHVAFLILHHMKKKQSNRKEELSSTAVERMYGSTFLQAMSDTTWILHKDKGMFYLIQAKLRADPDSQIKEPLRVALGEVQPCTISA